jgi:hypothetical protein
LLLGCGPLGHFTPTAVIRMQFSTPIDTLGWTQGFFGTHSLRRTEAKARSEERGQVYGVVGRPDSP